VMIRNDCTGKFLVSACRHKHLGIQSQFRVCERIRAVPVLISWCVCT
jgi:hypothetical protein